MISPNYDCLHLEFTHTFKHTCRVSGLCQDSRSISAWIGSSSLHGPQRISSIENRWMWLLGTLLSLYRHHLLIFAFVKRASFLSMFMSILMSILHQKGLEPFTYQGPFSFYIILQRAILNYRTKCCTNLSSAMAETAYVWHDIWCQMVMMMTVVMMLLAAHFSPNNLLRPVLIFVTDTHG